MSEEKMEMKKQEFDNIIKTLSRITQDKFGFMMKTNGKIYSNYLSNVVFENYKYDFKAKFPTIYASYDKAKGNELKEGRYPPKMASIASSSRFVVESIVKANKDIVSQIFDVESGEISFEKELECFEVRSAKPSLDAYLENKSHIALIEAKCHEIFDSHELDFRPEYEKTLKREFKLGEHEKEIEKNNYGKMTTYYRYNRDSFTEKDQRMMLDIKQMISHLLAAVKLSEDLNKSITLWYLFYKPKIDEMDDKNAIEIDRIFENLRKQINKLNEESNPIKNFLSNHPKIKLRFKFQHSTTMSPLTLDNTKELELTSSILK